MKRRITVSICIGVVAGLCRAGLVSVHADVPAYVPGSTEKVLQLTGDFDRQIQDYTLNLTGTLYGIPATDLGYGFEHKGRLYLLFGDTWTTVPSRINRDAIGYTTSTDPENLVLDFEVDGYGLFIPITIPGISHGGYEVPAGGGISLNDIMYIAFTTDHSAEETMGRSVLAKSTDDGLTFTYLYDLSDRDEDGKFIEVAMAEVDAADVPGLPTSGDTVLIWGSGKYRESDLYLACIPSSSIENKAALRYFCGTDASGAPMWSESESAAVPVFDHPVIGEFSVVWYDRVQRWLLLYNSISPRGIQFRHAVKPWEWSDMQCVFDPLTQGYAVFMHSVIDPLPNGISLSDPGREDEWGGEYCPAMLTRLFTGAGARHTIYFNMSTWNPYAVVVMRADIVFPPYVAVSAEPPNIGAGDRLELTVAGGGAAPFQWYRDGVPVADAPPRRTGAHTDTLVICPVGPWDEGSYYVTCDDGTGSSVTSESFALTLNGEGMPALGGLGLGLLAVACTLGGAIALRRWHMKQSILSGLTGLVALVAGAGLDTAAADVPVHMPGTTEKVTQLTGDFDRQYGEPTLNLTDTNYGIWGVDLGYGFEHKGCLYLLHGDCVSSGWRHLRDPISWTTSTDPENIILNVPTDPDGLFHPVTVPGVSHMEFESSAGNGISINDTMYIVFMTDHTEEEIVGRSVLARSDDDGWSFTYIYELSNRLSNGKFVEVAMVEVDAADVPGLPTSGGTVLIWGSGKYRESNPYLACIPSASIEDKSTIRYFSGTSQAGLPQWSTQESHAAPLFAHPQIGELSVVWYERVQRFIMLYGSLEPRGIQFRYAVKPWEWSDRQTIYHPWTDGGYGVFVHIKDASDGLSDPGREDEWGGEYCPAMLARFFTGIGARHTLYFTMSTWNPYQTVIMRTDILFPPYVAAHPAPPHTRVTGRIELTVAGDSAPPYAWYKDGVPLVDDPPHLTGTNAKTLVIDHFGPWAEGAYHATCDDGAGLAMETEAYPVSVANNLPAVSGLGLSLLMFSCVFGGARRVRKQPPSRFGELRRRA